MHLTNENDVTKCPKCESTLFQKDSDYPLEPFVGGSRIERNNGTLRERYICRDQACGDGLFNDEAIRHLLRVRRACEEDCDE